MQRPLRPALALATLTLMLAALLAACGGPASVADTTPPTITVTSLDTATAASYQLTGTVSDDVGVTDLSYVQNGGSSQTVTLSGDSFDVAVTLVSGANTFDLTASDAAGNHTTVTFTVTYTPPPPPTPGTLSITLNPPATAAADVDVTGAGFSQTLTATATTTVDLTGLAPGSYAITPNTVQDTTYSYAGTATEGGNPVTSVDVVAGQTTSVTVDYQVVDGALTITWSGQTLPAGYDYHATVTDANGNANTVTAPSRAPSASTVPYLAVGTATVTPTDLAPGCTAKVNSTDQPTITAGATASVSIIYKCN